MKKFVASLILLFASGPVFAQVSVKGTGVVYAKPDCAHLNFVVATEHAQAAKAHSQNRTASDAFFGVVKKNNVDDKDVSTVHFRISPKYSYPKEGDPKLVGYVVTHHLSVKVRDLKNVGALIDGTIGDSVRLEGISFDVSDKSSLQAKARDLALADAKKKAQQLVNGLGENLGKLVSVTEFVENLRPTAFRAMAMDSEARADVRTRVASGEQAITVHVDAVWGVKSVPPALPPGADPVHPPTKVLPVKD